MSGVDIAVAQDDVVVTVVNTLGCLLAQLVESLVKTFLALGSLEHHVELHGVEALVAYVLQNVELGVGQDWMWQANHLAVALVGIKDA